MKLVKEIIKFLEFFYDEKKYEELIKLVFIILYLFPISNFKNSINKSKLNLIQNKTVYFYERLTKLLSKYKKKS